MIKKIILLILSLLLLVSAVGCIQLPSAGETTQPSTQGTSAPTTNQKTEPATQPTTAPTTEPTTAPTTMPTEPPIVKEATATIGATGDILMHDNVIKSGYDKETKSYNFDEIFQYLKLYASEVDYAVANLEVTLAGNDNGYSYKGYPCFNCPDAIVDALKEAGFDMLLTANNHTYDTGHTGLLRTQEIILDRGLNYIGTRQDPEDANYSVVDVNGIRIGMINYTYNTSQNAEGKVALNGISLSTADSQLVNTFNYSKLDAFYEKLQLQLDAMRAEGAEAIVMYIHWGEEYQIKHNSRQAKIAQQLCNMGIDVIVGNHAHVPQDMELLTSETDENHKTACLYSTGNAVSNIYRGGWVINTEDGMLFQFTFAKYSDGTVVLESADVLPTWVYRHREDGILEYPIMAMGGDAENWKETMSLTDSLLEECQNSFNRTMDIVGNGLADINEWCREHQAAVEAELGVATDD